MRIRQVLVVEDDWCLYHAIERCLRLAFKEVQICWAMSAQEAKDALSTNQIEFVISDFRLCGWETGLDLWRDCQRKRPQLPFVLISAISVPEFLRQTENSRITPPFLAKPFRPDDLIGLIQSLQKQSSDKRAA